jgi:hypothetical protein
LQTANSFLLVSWFFDPEDEGNMPIRVYQKTELFNTRIFSLLTYLLEDHGWREIKYCNVREKVLDEKFHKSCHIEYTTMKYTYKLIGCDIFPPDPNQIFFQRHGFIYFFTYCVPIGFSSIFFSNKMPLSSPPPSSLLTVAPA